MAEHNALTFFPDFGKGVVKVLGLGQDESGVTRVSETLYPLIDLFAPYNQDRSHVIGERRFAVSGTTPIAPALQFATVALNVNAIDRNLMCIVERIRVSDRVRLDWRGSSIANPVALTAPCKDDRNSIVGGNVNGSRTRCQYGDVPAITNPGWDSLAAGDFVNPGIVLVGNAVYNACFTQAAVASSFSFCIEFKERKAFPGELFLG